MIYPSIDKLLNTVDSKYQLVHIAAKRARQMAETGHYQLKTYISAKNIGRALEEVAAGLLQVKK